MSNVYDLRSKRVTLTGGPGDLIEAVAVRWVRFHNGGAAGMFVVHVDDQADATKQMLIPAGESVILHDVDGGGGELIDLNVLRAIGTNTENLYVTWLKR